MYYVFFFRNSLNGSVSVVECVCVHGHDSHTCAGFDVAPATKPATTVQRSRGARTVCDVTRSSRCRGGPHYRLENSQRVETSVQWYLCKVAVVKLRGRASAGGPILYQIVSQRKPTCLTGWPSHTTATQPPRTKWTSLVEIHTAGRMGLFPRLATNMAGLHRHFVVRMTERWPSKSDWALSPYKKRPLDAVVQQKLRIRTILQKWIHIKNYLKVFYETTRERSIGL